ncbi:nicotinamide mononucleotide transporter [Frischella sp. Ac48]|uniref:Nicotinamide riboside transporter PnuC n=1 Tax=Frischella japonica TaxID=2741544 RepID=A0ABR7QVF9_9GAMM|nr:MULTISPECIES: nicotinamide riboside transporter PnuC [Frischella]MBC9130006.1 nicotinamide mononucleotide transporter [Frischella japonica]MBX4132989.1 nicotinamide mononucleotide transporter [Frischella sp. Ac48]
MTHLILLIGRSKIYPYICLVLVTLAFLSTNPLQDFDQRYAISFVGSMCGLLCVILLAKRKNSGNVLGMMAAFGESTANFLGNNIGAALPSIFYFLSHVYGLVNWRKNQDTDKAVKVRQLKENHFLTILFFLIIAAFLNVFLTTELEAKNTEYQLIANCFIFGLGLIAQLLLMMRFSFNWYLWILLNVLTIGLNIYTHNPIIATQYLIYLFNAIYGVIEWKKSQK